MKLVVATDKKTGKSKEIACEENKIIECMNWLGSRLAYDLVAFESFDEDQSRSNGIPYGELIDRVRKRKEVISYAVFEADEDKYCENDYNPEPVEEEEVKEI